MKKTKLPGVITLLILTLITTVMWVGLNIYRAFSKLPEPEVPKEIIATMNPTLDTDTINRIESSLFFDENQVPPLTGGAPAATKAPTTLPLAPTASPTAVESPLPTASPTP